MCEFRGVGVECVIVAPSRFLARQHSVGGVGGVRVTCFADSDNPGGAVTIVALGVVGSGLLLRSWCSPALGKYFVVVIPPRTCL